MAQTIKLKRSATQGASPTTSQLELGEVAINTYDGKMYIKKNVGGTESIVEIGAGGSGGGLASSFTLYEYTATASQTTFSGSDSNSNTLAYDTGTPPKVLVYLNGVLLDHTTDYTATTGTSVVLTSGAAAGDLVQVAAYKSESSVALDIDLADNVKLKFGDDDDLQIYHDGTHSFIKDAGTGHIKILAGDFRVKNAGDTANIIRGDSGAEVSLWYNGSKKFETTSTGVDVTGALVADSGQIDGNFVVDTSTLYVNSTNNRVGIGTTSPNYNLDVAAAGGGINIGGSGAYLRWNSGDMQIKNEGSYKMGFYTYNSSDAALNRHMVIDTNGYVGIGTASPGVELDIKRHTNAYPLRIGSETGQGRAIVFADVAGTPTKYNWIAGTQYTVDNAFEITPSTAVGGYTFSSPALLIKQDGNVGIGTTSPGGVLDVDGTYGDFKVGDPSVGSRLTYYDTTRILLNSNDILFYTNNLTERMRIKSDGKVGIGTASPASELEVKGTTPVLTVHATTLTGTTLGDKGPKLLFKADSSTAGNGGEVVFAGAGDSDVERWAAISGHISSNSVNGCAGHLVFGTKELTTDTTISERLRITNTGNFDFNSGNFTEVGTISSGAITSSGNIEGAALLIDGNTAVDKSSNYMVFYDGSGAPALYAGNTSDNRNYYQSDNHRFRSNDANTNFAEIGSLGMIIGTNGPEANMGKLHVKDSDSGATPYQNGNGGITIERNGRAALNFLTPNTQDAYIFWGDPEDANAAYVGYEHPNDVLVIRSTGFVKTMGSGLNVSQGSLQMGGAAVIDSSRNITAGTISSGNITTTGYLRGPSTFTIDPAAHGDNTGTVVIAGNLQVDGTTTTINSTTLTVDDKNITLASGSTNAAAANGAGITVDCGSDTDAALTYVSATDDWKFNKPTRVSGLSNAGIGFTSTETLVDGSSLLPNGRIFYHSSCLIYDSPSSGHRFAVVGNQGTNVAMNISSSQNVGIGIGTTGASARFQVEEAGIDTTTTSTTATTQVAIDTFAAATFRSARYTIQVTNSTDSTYHLTEILLIHDGTTPQITEYGTIFTGSAEATFDADISSGNVRLLATPATTDSMTFKVVRHCITV